MIGSSDEVAPDFFSASKGQLVGGLSASTLKNIAPFSQKFRSRKIAKNKWRKQVKLRKNVHKHIKKQDVACLDGKGLGSPTGELSVLE